MWYELWDFETGNRIGRYPTEEAALDDVRHDIKLHGRDSDVVTTLGLFQHDPLMIGGGVIAEGPALVDRALGVEQSTERITA